MTRTVLLHAIALLLALLLLFVLLTSHVALPWVVAGPSMLPTLQPGDRVLVDPWSYRRRVPRPGEVVLLEGPRAQPGWLVKRAACLPPGGDRFPQPGPWDGLSSSRAGIWVLGDNPDRSLDSRRFGPVPRERLVGRIFWRYWPPSRFGSLPAGPPGEDAGRVTSEAPGAAL